MEKDPSTANGQNDPEARSKPDLNRFEHIQLGVWDLYIMRTQLLRYLPTPWKIEEYAQIWNDIPYLRRAVLDMSIAWLHLSAYLIVTLARSLVPALSLWSVCLFTPFSRKSKVLTCVFQGFLGKSLE